MLPPTLSNPSRIYDSVTELVGRTPLIQIHSHGVPEVELWAKLEAYNPGRSVKDRPALRMIQEGILTGKLTKDKIILDATSGNTGIAYGWIGAAMGYKVALAIPANVSDERKRILKSFNVEVHYSSDMEVRMGRSVWLGKSIGKIRKNTSSLTNITIPKILKPTCFQRLKKSRSFWGKR
jgi:cysteine synthase B